MPPSINPPTDLYHLVGEAIGNRYRILYVLGTGSFAIVYMAIDLHTKKQVAVKCLCKRNLDDRQRESQRREVTIMKALNGHPYIVTLLDFIDTPDYMFLVMEHCEMDLYEAITQKGGFPEDVVKEVFMQLVEAISHSHRHGIFHRDIKPENCLISNEYTLKLTDFGLSTSDQWSYEFGCGSVRYMAPECLAAEAETPPQGYSPAQNDIWSLGVILINLLFGKNPWHEAAPSDPLYSLYITSNPGILQDQFDLTPEFHAFLKSVLHPDPKKRFTLAELKESFSKIDFFTTQAKLFASPATTEHTLVGDVDDKRTPSFLSDGILSSTLEFEPADTFCIFNYEHGVDESKLDRQSSTSSCFSDVDEDETVLAKNMVVTGTPITPKDNLFQFFEESDGKNYFADMPVVPNERKAQPQTDFFGQICPLY